MTLKARPSASRHLPCARVSRVSDQLVGESSVSAVLFTGIEYDAPGLPTPMWNASLPSRLTAPEPGIYSCAAAINFQPDNQAYKQFRICLNGSGNVKCIMNNAWPSSVHQHASSLNCDIFMYATNYVELFCWHNKVGGLYLTGSAYAITLSLALVIPHTAGYTDWGGA